MNFKDNLPSTPLIPFFAKCVAYCDIIFKLRDLLDKCWLLLLSLILTVIKIYIWVNYPLLLKGVNTGTIRPL